MKLDGSVSIGRAFDNTICIEHSSISRYHALIEQRADGFWLSDLGSINGTVINDAPITSEHKLNEGDIISVGNVSTIEVRSSDARPQTQAASAQASAKTEQPAQPATSELPDETKPLQQPDQKESRSSGLSPMVIIAAVAAGLAVTIVAALLLIPSSPGASIDKAQTPNSRSDAAVRKQDPPEAEINKDADEKDGTEEAENKQPPATDEYKKAGDVTMTQGEVNVALLSQNLAGLIVRKSGTGYSFEPEFAARIRSRTDEYRIDTSEYVRSYRFQINKAFSTNPLPPVVGYILAMSRSRFKIDANDPGSVGLWRVPREIALTYKTPEEDESVLNDTAHSAEIAARYLKSLIDIFGPDDFMYAIACFGMSTSRAGDIKNRLEQQADPAARRDFWSMVKSGVVTREDAERVVRFFAAGIVAENPQEFRMGSQPLSWLIMN